MNLSAIHKLPDHPMDAPLVVCDIGGYEFVSYSQVVLNFVALLGVVCDIGGYEFVSYSQEKRQRWGARQGCL